MTSDPFASLEAGSRASLVRSFSRADAAAFQAFYGIHADEGGDSGLIGQMLLGAAVSALLGTKLPGTGALWFEQEFIYHDPIRFGEPLRIEGQVLHKSEAQRALALSVKVSGENGRLCLEGTARVRMTTSAASKTAESQVQPGAVIVTGAGRGIGAAIAKALAASGYAVLINARSNKDQADEVAREIIDSGGRALVHMADVGDPGQAKGLVEAALASFGALHGLVNNAAPPPVLRSCQDVSWDDIQRQMDVQLKGAHALIQASLPGWLSQGRGVVVNIGSVLHHGKPAENMLAYGAAKAALAFMTKALAAELGPKGIRVNMVSPGMTDTGMIRDMPEKAKLLARAQAPLRRLADPQDIAAAVVFLMGQSAKHITGIDLVVDGGSAMP